MLGGAMTVLTDDMKRVVREQSLAFVATVCPDGSPNVSPKGTISVWDDEHLIFADIASPNTMANLVGNPDVELNIIDPVVRKGYRFKGRATVITDGPELQQALQFFARERGTDTSRVRGVAMITVLRAAALISPAYGAGATEQEVVDRFTRRFEEIYGWKIEHRARA
jgi:predicted pyridoxine 5'-phosphate oxidase superfamily flavin-nucleotide-binding protein